MNDKFSVTNVKDKEAAAAAVSEAVTHRLDELEKGITAELEKVDIKDGDVFLVKATGDDFDPVTMKAFKESLKSKFPKVEFIVLAIPSGNKIEFKKLPKDGGKS